MINMIKCQSKAMKAENPVNQDARECFLNRSPFVTNQLQEMRKDQAA